MSSERQRLHRAGIAVMALDALRDAALPAVIGLIAIAGGRGADGGTLARGLGLAIAGTLAAALFGYLRWRTTSFAITDDAVDLRRGILSVQEVSIPLERVQALDTVAGPVQRLFGVTALHVQTAGGGREGEIVLSAVTPAVAERLREAVAGRRAITAIPAIEDAVADHEAPREARLSRGMLLAAALTSGQIGVILPLLVGASQLFDDLLFPRGRVSEAEAGLLPDSVGELLLVGAGLAVAAWLLAIGGAIVAFAGFRVARDDDRLRISRGLLQRRVATIAVDRIQAVRVVEGVLRQPFGFAALRVESLGSALEPAAHQTLFPLLRRSEVEPFLERFLPELADALEPLSPPPARAARRYAFPPVLAALAAGGAAALALGSAWPLLAVLPAAAYGLARHRAAGWRLDGGRLAVRFRIFARTTVLAPARRLQEHELRQSPFQRRARLATVGVAVGKGARAHVAHLEAGTAQQLFDRLRPVAPAAGLRLR